MRRLNNPYYLKYITRKLERFDDRNTGFSRGAKEGDKYTLISKKGAESICDAKPGRTIMDHALVASCRTVDYALRKTEFARNGSGKQDRIYRLKNADPASLTKIVKSSAQWFGADLVGITKLNTNWIYSHWGIHNVKFTGAAKEGDPVVLPSGLTHVIVMIHEMDYDLILRTPDYEPSSTMAYSKMAWCAATLASFIREMGFRAVPCGNEMGISIPMAVDAGLGEMGRNGLLITREFGPRVRISKVFTDLPLLADRPIDIGVQKFCEKCGRCAESCPSNTIVSGERTDKGWDKSNSKGMLKWPVNAMKCLDWWVKNGSGCSICIRVCPWNKRNSFFHKIVRVFAERNILTDLIIFSDKMLGYGKQRKGKGPFSIKDPSVTRLE